MACTRTRGSEEDDWTLPPAPAPLPPRLMSANRESKWLDKSEGAGSAVRLACFLRILRVASELAD